MTALTGNSAELAAQSVAGIPQNGVVPADVLPPHHGQTVLGQTVLGQTVLGQTVLGQTVLR